MEKTGVKRYIPSSTFTTQVKWVQVAQLCPTLSDPMDCPWNSLGQNAGVGSLSLLQEVFPTQGLNPGLLHCRQILYHLSQQGSPVNLLINLKKERESTFKREKESVPAYLVQNGRLLFYFVELGNEKHHSWQVLGIDLPFFFFFFFCCNF